MDNYVSKKDAAWFARFYASHNLRGGHIILLNPASSSYYGATRQQALSALQAWPGGMQIGGGIRTENAAGYLEAGASHVIVTSYVFRDGQIHWKNLESLRREVGREHLVLDLSCRKKEGAYYIVTDRWQKFTQVELTLALLDELSASCGEFLIHAADVEGKSAGIEQEVAALLGDWGKLPVTYAGGVGSLEDLHTLARLGKGRVDVTIGSALDLFGGNLPFTQVLQDLERV